MPDEAGNKKADPPATPMGAYKDGRAEDVEEGSLGKDPDESRLPEGAEEPGSYQSGGHAEAPEEPEPVQVDSGSGTAGTAKGAMEDTPTHPDAGDEGLASKTGGLDEPSRRPAAS